jgi:hypothetical protein
MHKVRCTLEYVSNVILSLEPGEISGIVLGYRMDHWGFESWQGLGILLSPPCPYQLRDPPSLLSNM